MKKLNFIYIAFLLIIPAISIADVDDDDVLDELDELYDAQPKIVTVKPNKTNVDPNEDVEPSIQRNSQRRKVHKQPQVYVESTPLEEGSFKQAKDRRQQLEIKNENSVLEEIENERISNEAELMKKFKSKLGDSAPTPTPMPLPTLPPPPPAPILVQPDPIDVKGEVRSALAEMRDEKNIQPVEEIYYIHGLLGVAEYPGTINVRGNYAFGVGGGMKVNDRILIEGGFLSSSFEVEKMYSDTYPSITDMQQYTGMLSTKFQFFTARMRPVVGALVAYQYRVFTDKKNSSYYGGGGQASSNAVDLGLLTGVDVELTKGFSIGAEFKYLWNMTSKTSSSLGSIVNPARVGTPIEKLNQYLFTINGRLNF